MCSNFQSFDTARIDGDQGQWLIADFEASKVIYLNCQTDIIQPSYSALYDCSNFSQQRGCNTGGMQIIPDRFVIWAIFVRYTGMMPLKTSAEQLQTGHLGKL